jgi:hypothetical protein
MSRSPIQVPEEIKEGMEVFKDKLHAKSHHELISKLMKFHEDTQRQQWEQSQKRREEEERQKREMIQLGEKQKEIFDKIKIDMGFDEDVQVFALLYEHFMNSRTIDMITFDMYRNILNKKGY